MSVDPTIFGIPSDNIAAFANGATALAAACAAIVAYCGLHVWRREMKGRRNAELAEEVLAAFYEAQEIYRWVRTRGHFPNEADSRVRQEEEDEKLGRALDALFIPLARIKAEHETLSKLYAKRYRFRAIFGPEADKPFQALRKAENQIASAARMLTRLAIADHRRGHRVYSARELRPERVAQEEQNREKYQARIWGSEDEDDEIAQRIDRAVKEIEAICRPAIEGRVK